MANAITITSPTSGQVCNLAHNITMAYSYDENTAGTIEVTTGKASGTTTVAANSSGNAFVTVTHGSNHLGATVTAKLKDGGGTVQASTSVAPVDFQGGPGGGGGSG